jgi:hypothetical protein
MPAADPNDSKTADGGLPLPSRTKLGVAKRSENLIFSNLTKVSQVNSSLLPSV